MIKNANELRSLCRNKREINTIKREILYAIEQKLIETNRDGQTNIFFEVPKQYPSIGSDPDAITQIVAGVLAELVEGDYDVQIRSGQNVYIFSIRWSAELPAHERQKISKLLKNHLVEDFDNDS
jgi:hypothetical protein